MRKHCSRTHFDMSLQPTDPPKRLFGAGLPSHALETAVLTHSVRRAVYSVNGTGRWPSGNAAECELGEIDAEP